MAKEYVLTLLEKKDHAKLSSLRDEIEKSSLSKTVRFLMKFYRENCKAGVGYG